MSEPASVEQAVLRAIVFSTAVADAIDTYLENPDQFDDNFLEKIRDDAEEVRKMLRLIYKEIK